MPPSESCLALYLDAPMQSWGNQSRFKLRTSLPYPTKSGIVGLLAAARGIPRNDEEGIRTLAELRLEVLVFRNAQRMTDFHTVGGGFDPKTERQWMSVKANAAKPDPVITRRDYLCDGKFGAILQGSEDVLSQCSEALRNPRWGIWLGRKSCIPTSPVVRGIFETGEEALDALTSVAGRTPVRRIADASFEEGTDTILDHPLNFDQRTFGSRRITDQPF